MKLNNKLINDIAEDIKVSLNKTIGETSLKTLVGSGGIFFIKDSIDKFSKALQKQMQNLRDLFETSKFLMFYEPTTDIVYVNKKSNETSLFDDLIAASLVRHTKKTDKEARSVYAYLNKLIPDEVEIKLAALISLVPWKIFKDFRSDKNLQDILEETGVPLDIIAERLKYGE